MEVGTTRQRRTRSGECLTASFAASGRALARGAGWDCGAAAVQGSPANALERVLGEQRKRLLDRGRSGVGVDHHGELVGTVLAAQNEVGEAGNPAVVPEQRSARAGGDDQAQPVGWEGDV